MLETKSIIDTGWNLDNSYARLPEVFFTKQSPAVVPSPKLIVFNEKLAVDIGLNIHELQSPDGIAVLSGNEIPEGSVPLTQAYAGHQFGHFTMLGDGRALLLGEQMTPSGKRVDIQLKGSGRTLYSRNGDGLAALGPMLREYIISEAMHGLGIPTTRSLAVVTTGKSVSRETKQIGAVLTRTAASHLRVGTFQYAAEWCSTEELQALADYALQRHFSKSDTDENPYLFLLKQVIKGQAELIAKWQLVGFIHGVMNTDNMTISGETIDYGPCAFMDTYNHATVFSSIDIHGRYAYGNQPRIALWNLARFAETLLPLLHDKEDEALKIAQDAISDFSNLYHQNWISGMRGKLGIFNEEPEDEILIEELFKMMQKYEVDYTNTFRALTLNKISGTDLFNATEFQQWIRAWQQRLERETQAKEASQQLMRNSNPAIIPRNHRVEEALEAAINGDYSVMNNLLTALSNPFAYSSDQEYYAALPELPNCHYQTFCGT